MPNWCENELYVTGQQLDTLLAMVRSTDEDGIVVIDFNKIVPMPASLQITSPPQTEDEKRQAVQNKKLYGAETWYEWCRDRWGTKWNACESQIAHRNGSHALITFNTAWTPPLPVIQALGERFPTMRFRLDYYEGVAGYSGTFAMEGGKIVRNAERAYSGPRGG
jgi:hypothetical protein